ncbi:MAG: sugar ABC transporter permease YjfF [Spirochaetales bacterium]|nr:sugar ABC transporter permease YjfF [Spirochaetales bacterium]
MESVRKQTGKPKEPISSTTLLLTITISTFIAMYLLAMIVWGGGFLNPQQFLDIFNNNAYLIVISCGVTLVMITAGIDISVGGTVALITMACVVFMEDYSGSVAASIILALGIGLAMGIVQGFLVAYLKIQPFIVTLAGMFFTKGMTTIVSKAPRTATNEVFLAMKNFRIELPFGTYGKTGNFIPARIEPGVIIALAIVFIVWVVLKWSRFGRNVYAVGGNSESALMLGINVKRTKFFAYVLSGIFAGIGGYVYLMHTGAGNAANAYQAEIQAIASSIIGGTLLTGGVGSVIGTLFGVMSLKTINNIVIASGLREPYWQSITTGLMLCFFILLQSVILTLRKKKRQGFTTADV